MIVYMLVYMLTYRWYACSAEMKNATQRCRMQQTNKKEQTSTGGSPLDVRTFGTHFRSISGDHDLDKSQKNHKRNKQKNTGNDKHMQQLAPFSEHPYVADDLSPQDSPNCNGVRARSGVSQSTIFLYNPQRCCLSATTFRR